MVVTELYGFGCFRLLPAHGATIYEGDTSTLYAHYVHPKLIGGVSISVGGYGSFDISGGLGYDERGTHYSFTVYDPTSE